MADISQTFEQLFIKKLKADLSNYILDRRMFFAVDVNVGASDKNINFTGKEIITVVRTGGGNRSASEGNIVVQQNVTIIFYTPQIYMQEFLKYITDYCHHESKLGNIQTLDLDTVTKYYFYVDYVTPYSDDLSFQLKGKNYKQIMLTGSVLYSTSPLPVGNDKVKINGVELVNVETKVSSLTPIGENYDMSGVTTQVVSIVGNTSRHDFRALYEPTNALHQQLKVLANAPGNARVALQINDETAFNALMTVQYMSTSIGFNYFQISMQRDDS